MNNAVFIAAAEGATKNPLIPEIYDIVWSGVVFAIILVAFWKLFLPKLQKMLDERAAAIEVDDGTGTGYLAEGAATVPSYPSSPSAASLSAAPMDDEPR